MLRVALLDLPLRSVATGDDPRYPRRSRARLSRVGGL